MSRAALRIFDEPGAGRQKKRHEELLCRLDIATMLALRGDGFGAHDALSAFSIHIYARSYRLTIFRAPTRFTK